MYILYLLIELYLISVYTFFALFEYLVVLSNMAFHLTSVWDLAGVSLVIDDNLNLTYR